MKGIDLSKQHAQDDDLKVIQLINFTENVENNASIFFIIKEVKETILNFLQGTVRVF